MAGGKKMVPALINNSGIAMDPICDPAYTPAQCFVECNRDTGNSFYGNNIFVGKHSLVFNKIIIGAE